MKQISIISTKIKQPNKQTNQTKTTRSLLIQAERSFASPFLLIKCYNQFDKSSPFDLHIKVIGPRQLLNKKCLYVLSVLADAAAFSSSSKFWMMAAVSLHSDSSAKYSFSHTARSSAEKALTRLSRTAILKTYGEG